MGVAGHCTGPLAPKNLIPHEPREVVEEAEAQLSELATEAGVLQAWELCAPAGLLMLLVRVKASVSTLAGGEDVVVDAALDLLRYFVLRSGWQVTEPPPAEPVGRDLAALLGRAEAEAVGRFRAMVAASREPFVRCDVCCSHATCPHQEQPEAEHERQQWLEGDGHRRCPKDRRFDAVQDRHPPRG